MADFKITEKQRKYLNSLVCQRISDKEENKQVIKDFSNDRSSPGIVRALKKGWNADKEDRIAYYIIKDPADNQPMLFFSLKCGELHLQLDPENLNKSVKQSLMKLRAAELRCKTVRWPGWVYQLGVWEMFHFQNFAMEMLRAAREIQVEDWARDVVENQLEDGVLPLKAWEEIWDRVIRSQNKQNSFNAEMKLEGQNIIRTEKTFAAVELVHFCAHEPAREKWAKLGMGQSLGRTMFWQFIEPKILEIRKLVGCEYVYLFAADKNREGRLVVLYKGMGFEFREDLYVMKPAYDFECFFMCRKAVGLRTLKNEFLNNFNKPDEAGESAEN